VLAALVHPSYSLALALVLVVASVLVAFAPVVLALGTMLVCQSWW
jgi:hypothetical protein